MAVEYEYDVSALKDAFREAERNLAKHIPAALQLGAHLVAAHAKQVHDYVDRTDLLTNSIMADDVQGGFESGDLEVTVSAGAPYALFVEEDTKAHVIRPKHKKSLAWGVEGGIAFAGEVNHPGTTGTHFLANANEAKAGEVAGIIEDAAALSFEQAGFDVED